MTYQSVTATVDNYKQANEVAPDASTTTGYITVTDDGTTAYNFHFQFGLANTSLGKFSSGGHYAVFFYSMGYYSDGNGRMECYCSDGSYLDKASFDKTLTQDVEYKFEIIISGTTAVFKIDGSTVATITSMVPTNGTPLGLVGNVSPDEGHIYTRWADTPTAVDPPILARFTASASSGASPLSITFTDTSIPAATSWSWNFGDGSTSTSQNPVHIFTSSGTKSVTLTASNEGGSDTSDPMSITVYGAPTAYMVENPASGTVPLTVQFSDASVGFPDTWLWNFGDGATSGLQHPSHEYTVPSRFYPTLTITNTYGSGYISGVVNTYTNPVSLTGINDIWGMFHPIDLTGINDVRDYSVPISLTGISVCSHGVPSKFWWWLG